MGEKKVQYPHYTPYTRGPQKRGFVSDSDLQLELPLEPIKDRELSNRESQVAFRRIYDYYKKNPDQQDSLHFSQSAAGIAKSEFDQFEETYLSMKEIGSILDKAYREISSL